MGGGRSKTILFIGCSGRLGTAFVKKYSSLYRIIGVARREPEHVKLLAHFIQGDASADWERVATEALTFENDITVLINNAAYFDPAPLAEKKIQNFSSEVQLNLISPFAFSQHFLRHWRKFSPEENRQKNSCIINLGSIAGQELVPNVGHGTYSPLKAALHLLTLHMANEWERYGVRVNGIAPHRFGDAVPYEKILSTLEELIEGKINGVVVTLPRQ